MTVLTTMTVVTSGEDQAIIEHTVTMIVIMLKINPSWKKASMTVVTALTDKPSWMQTLVIVVTLRWRLSAYKLRFSIKIA